MAYFLFIASGEPSETRRRVSAKKWPFFSNTKNADKIEKGDRAIIYQGGTGGQQFVADVEVASVTDTDKNKEIVFSKANVWKKPLQIKMVYFNLDIIKRPEYFGVYLAGGIKNLSKKDFDTIVAARK